MATTYQYKYITGYTFDNTGTASGIEVIVEALDTDLPDFKKQYSAASHTEASAKDAIKFELDNFGVFVNGVDYPKTGTPIPGQEPSDEETQENTPTSDSDIENNTGYEIYILSDGSSISVKKYGPFLIAVVTKDWEGVPFKPGEVIHEGEKSAAASWKTLADEALIFINNLREDNVLAPIEITEIVPVPPPPPPPDPVSYKFKGRVIDLDTLDFLGGVLIKDDKGNEVTSTIPTTPEGEPVVDEDNFIIEGMYTPTVDNVSLTLSLEEYVTQNNLTIVTKDGSLNDSINPIKLKKSGPETQAGMGDAMEMTDEQRRMMEAEELADFVAKMVNSLIKKLQEIVIAMIIRELLGKPFGIWEPMLIIQNAKAAVKKLQDQKEDLKEKKEKKKEDKTIKKVKDKQEKEEVKWTRWEDEIKAIEDNPDLDEDEKEKESKKIRIKLKESKEEFADWAEDQLKD